MASVAWQQRYQKKLASPKEALKHIKRGSRIFIGSGCGEPRLLVKTLEEKVKDRGDFFIGTYTHFKPQFLPAGYDYSPGKNELLDVEVIHSLSLGDAPYAKPEHTQAFRHKSFFIGPQTRQAVLEGRADYLPVFFSEVPDLLRRGRIPIDVALIQVSPPDEHGFCSYGVSVDITKAAAESADIVIAEVNSQMPRTLGDSFIHVNDIDVLVENDAPVLELRSPSPDEIDLKIAEYVGELVENGSTLQIGMGIIPGALLPALKDKKDLGIHTEMLNEGILDLIECGAVTNKKKTIHQGKVIASLCMGTRRLYDFIDNNPFFEFHPSDYVNNPFVISQNDNMVAINTALEVDLTGQVCADSLGYQFYSGIGGHVDFLRGAARSRGGKAIIVLSSTTRDGSKSRIVPYFDEGAGVAITRGDVRYVVTEYGIADLYGKNIRDRVMALINIAHPKFREGLLSAAKKYHYVYADQILMPLEAQYPRELETWGTFRDGLSVFFRPVKQEDERKIQEFFYSLSDQSLYYRFLRPQKRFPHAQAQLYATVNYLKDMAIVGMAMDEKGVERVVALGQYFAKPESNIAEVALAIADRYQNKGIGNFLLNYLVRIAKERGIAGFTAIVESNNYRMMHLFHKCGYTVESTLECGAYSVSLKF